MRRRSFITLIGGAAVWPLAAHAQPPTMSVVGFMSFRVAWPASSGARGLRGWLKGSRLHRRAKRNGRIPLCGGSDRSLSGARIRTGRTQGGRACREQQGRGTGRKASNRDDPDCVLGRRGPGNTGLVASLNRPGGNLTGVYQFNSGLEGKRLGLLHELVPKATTLAVLIHPNNSPSESQLRDARRAVRLGVQLVVVRANAESEFGAAFSTAVQQKAAALLVCASPFFNLRRQQLVVLAARHALPAIYEWRDFAAAGGLMSYGTRLADAYRQAGVYAGHILKGAKPADLPVVQVTKFEFVINLSTAKALGIEVPPPLSARADEVIE